jgi:hypothetical protein
MKKNSPTTQSYPRGIVKHASARISLFPANGTGNGLDKGAVDGWQVEGKAEEGFME